MKITKSRLTKIIKEELSRVITESPGDWTKDEDFKKKYDISPDDIAMHNKLGSIWKVLSLSDKWNPTTMIRPGGGFTIGYNPGPSGGRYINTQSLSVWKDGKDSTGALIVDTDDDWKFPGTWTASQLASKKMSGYGMPQFITILSAIQEGIFVGPSLLSAVSEASQLIADSPPMGDPNGEQARKLRSQVNRLISAGYSKDVRDGTLLSDQFSYSESAKRGWDRAS